MHTPGPWVWGEWHILPEDREAQRRGDPYWTLSKPSLTRDLMRGPWGRKAMDTETIARAEGYETDGIGVNDDDAALIAAAPDLLDALTLIANETREDAAAWMRSVARAAIAKAKGE